MFQLLVQNMEGIGFVVLGVVFVVWIAVKCLLRRKKDVYDDWQPHP